MSKRKEPIILEKNIVARSRFFCVEELKLRFSNGALRTFERLRNTGRRAVMLVPMKDEDTVLLVREYAAGAERYELTLPKGLVEPEEDLLVAANRELMEEVGVGANNLQLLAHLSSSPGYIAGSMPVVIARDLYPQKLEGDEPEPLEVVEWKLSRLMELIAQEDFTEARSIAALFLVRELMNNEKKS